MNDIIRIEKYNDLYEKKWDEFVLDKSSNGTFLQTRNFLNYHKNNKFRDFSLMFIYGDEIIAVIPAHIDDDNCVYSHNGSTFGGLIISKAHKNIKFLEIIFDELDKYLHLLRIKKIVLKQTGNIYQKDNANLLDYFLFVNNYKASYEIGYYIDFSSYNENIIDNFNASTRRAYRNSMKNCLIFKPMSTKEEISIFYEILCNNYAKFNKTPIHTLDDLYDFYFNRLIRNVKFYGVLYNDVYIAGAMIFDFDNRVFHTQYIASLQEYTKMHIGEFIYYSLINEAKKEDYKYISFGTAVLNGGKTLNKSLAQFKEGFGTSEYLNKIYTKNYSY